MGVVTLLEDSNPSSCERPLPENFTPELGFRMWYDVMEACDELLRAGIRHEVGPDGDFEAAYRRWHEERYAEHEQGLLRMAAQLNKAAEKAPPPGP